MGRIWHNEDGSLQKVRLDMTEEEFKVVAQALKALSIEMNGYKNGTIAARIYTALHEGM